MVTYFGLGRELDHAHPRTAGLVEAKKRFRRVNGHLHLKALLAALDEHVGPAVTPHSYTS